MQISLWVFNFCRHGSPPSKFKVRPFENGVHCSPLMISCWRHFLPLDEAMSSGVVIVILSGADGWKRFCSPLIN